MCIYFFKIVSLLRVIIKVILHTYSNINTIDTFFSIICNIVTIIIMIWGVTVIKSVKEKKVIATFSFYAKLKVHLKVLKNQLGTEECTILFYFYTDDIISANGLTVPNNKSDFLDCVKKLLDFLETDDNQVMPSKSFYTSLYTLVDFLSECIMIENYRPFSQYNDNKPIKAKLDSINCIIDSLIRAIDLEQNKIHNKSWSK